MYVEEKLPIKINAQRIEAGEATSFTNEQINELERSPIDYEDELFRTALAHNINASVSGGTNKINYFISGNYLDQEGIVTNNNSSSSLIRVLNCSVNW